MVAFAIWHRSWKYSDGQGKCLGECGDLNDGDWIEMSLDGAVGVEAKWVHFAYDYLISNGLTVTWVDFGRVAVQNFLCCSIKKEGELLRP